MHPLTIQGAARCFLLFKEPKTLLGAAVLLGKSTVLRMSGNMAGVLTGTVHLVALVLACRPAVTLPGHGDTLHLPAAAGELPRAAALL